MLKDYNGHSDIDIAIITYPLLVTLRFLRADTPAMFVSIGGALAPKTRFGSLLINDNLSLRLTNGDGKQ